MLDFVRRDQPLDCRGGAGASAGLREWQQLGFTGFGFWVWDMGGKGLGWNGFGLSCMMFLDVGFQFWISRFEFQCLAVGVEGLTSG